MISSLKAVVVLLGVPGGLPLDRLCPFSNGILNHISLMQIYVININ